LLRRYRAMALCPRLPSRFPDSGQSAKPRFCQLGCSEAAVGDLALRAIKRQSPEEVIGPLKTVNGLLTNA
jgi:hypothetical protein